MDFGADRRKTLLVEDCPKMGNALYIWSMQELSKYTLLSEEILKASAMEFYRKITRKDDFCASIWLVKLKSDLVWVSLPVWGEKLSGNESGLQSIMKR